MKTTTLQRLAGVLAASLACLGGAAQAHDGPHDGDGKESRAILQARPLPDVAGNKGLMLTVTYAPGQKSIPHRHPGSVFAYVLDGAVISSLDDGPEVTYQAGDSWYESPGARHVVSRNASATKPARLLVFLLVPDGAQVAEPLPK